jgi:hypothetical protein
MTATKIEGYVPPEVPKSGYSFVAAASLYRNYAGLAVFVKYKGGPKHKISIKDAGQNHLWLVCPDRELVIVRNAYETGSFYPYGESFDEVHDFNLFNDEVCKDLGIEYIMTNYAHTQNKEQHPRLKAKTSPQKRINVLSDSGGLQLARGVSGIITPQDLIGFYNKNVDAGMVLDIPMGGVHDPKTLKRAAEIQRENTNIMLAESKGSELINIFHGTTVEQRKMFRETVEDERIDRVAMAALHTRSLVSATNEVYNTVHGSSKRYKQYHALGIYISTYIPMLVKLANSGENPPHITSDSTSHIQSARNKSYHFQFDIYHNSKRLAIGSRGSVPNTGKLLPCQCPVCRVLKYTDVLAFGPLRYVMELLSVHNAIEMTRYAGQLQEACLQLKPREFNKLVEMQLKSHPELKQVKASLDFIDIASSDGLKAARAKYINFANVARSSVDRQTAGLFAVLDEKKESKAEEKIKHTNSILDQMEPAIKEWKSANGKTKKKKLKAKEKSSKVKTKSKKAKGKVKTKRKAS